MSDAPTSSSKTPPPNPMELKSSSDSSSGQVAVDSSIRGLSSSSVQLSRSRHTWTEAGSAAGFVLRYLTPMRRLMIQVCGSEVDADRALAILIAHLVKAGYGGHDKGRLRDFLVRGIRSAAKAQFEEATQQLETEKKKPSSGASAQAKVPSKPPRPPSLDSVQLESTEWVTYWREGLLQRAWRSLERFQHAQRYQRPTDDELLPADAPTEDLVHDVLRVAMSHPSESAEVLAGRVASKAGHSVTPDEVKRQLGIARVRFAQLIADEVAQTLQDPTPKGIQAEIKALELQKAFAGVKILP